MLRNITEVAYEYNIQLDILFIDFKQAFDSIYRYKMIKILLLQVMPSKLIRLNRMILWRLSSTSSYREQQDRNL